MSNKIPPNRFAPQRAGFLRTQATVSPFQGRAFGCHNIPSMASVALWHFKSILSTSRLPREDDVTKFFFSFLVKVWNKVFGVFGTFKNQSKDKMCSTIEKTNIIHCYGFP